MKATVKMHELQELTEKEREEKLSDLREEYFNLKFQLSTGKIENPGRLRYMRRDIARILTLKGNSPAVEPSKAGKEKESKQSLRRLFFLEDAMRKIMIVFVSLFVLSLAGCDLFDSTSEEIDCDLTPELEECIESEVPDETPTLEIVKNMFEDFINEETFGYDGYVQFDLLNYDNSEVMTLNSSFSISQTSINTIVSYDRKAITTDGVDWVEEVYLNLNPVEVEIYSRDTYYQTNWNYDVHLVCVEFHLNKFLNHM